MAYKTLATNYFVKKETEFNKGAVFTQEDKVEVTSDTALKPNIDSIERKVINCTYINKPGLPGKESGSGTLAFELIPKGGDSKDIEGGVVLEVCLGQREEPGLGTGAIIRADAAPQVEVTITADPNNTGDGNITDFGYNDDRAVTETWTIECVNADNAGAEEFSVTGSVSGAQPNAIVGQPYDNGIIRFKIVEGSTNFAVGDKFTIDMVSHIAYKIYEVKEGEQGEAVLYKLGRPCGTDASLTAKVLYGCDETDSRSLTLTGIVPNSVQFNIPVADICTVSFDIAAAGFNTAEGEPIPACKIEDAAIPYVGKNAKFIVGNTAKEAKDVQLTIENTVSDREAITGSGIARKVITKKSVKGSFTVIFENWDELNKFKNSESGELYLELQTVDSADKEHRFAIYLPHIRYTSVSVEDDDGVLVNKIEFEGYIDPASGEAIYIAHK
jgi:hypothetical protein